jgi:hypothetical protein
MPEYPLWGFNLPMVLLRGGWVVSDGRIPEIIA